MSRTHRLFQMMTALRRLPAPVRAVQIADEMQVSLRTVYRDIPALAKAAQSALAKLTARVPPRQSHRLQHAVLDARRFSPLDPPRIDVAELRAATWAEDTVGFSYTDGKGQASVREVDPLGLIFMQGTSMLMAWCHLRQDFRAFRLDRMDDLHRTGASFRPRRVAMLRDHMALIRTEQEARAEGRLG